MDVWLSVTQPCFLLYGMASSDIPWLLAWILLINALLQVVQWLAVDLMYRGLMCRGFIPPTALYTI
jgi:hypothetical protein